MCFSKAHKVTPQNEPKPRVFTRPAAKSITQASPVERAQNSTEKQKINQGGGGG